MAGKGFQPFLPELPGAKAGILLCGKAHDGQQLPALFCQLLRCRKRRFQCAEAAAHRKCNASFFLRAHVCSSRSCKMVSTVRATASPAVSGA